MTIFSIPAHLFWIFSFLQTYLFFFITSIFCLMESMPLLLWNICRCLVIVSQRLSSNSTIIFFMCESAVFVSTVLLANCKILLSTCLQWDLQVLWNPMMWFYNFLFQDLIYFTLGQVGFLWLLMLIAQLQITALHEESWLWFHFFSGWGILSSAMPWIQGKHSSCFL